MSSSRAHSKLSSHQSVLEQNEDLIAAVVENMQLGRLTDCYTHHAMLQGNLLALSRELDDVPVSGACDPFESIDQYPDEIMRKDALDELRPREQIPTTTAELPPPCEACRRQNLPAAHCRLYLQHVAPPFHLSPEERREYQRVACVLYAQCLSNTPNASAALPLRRKARRRWSLAERHSVLIAVSVYGPANYHKIAGALDSRSHSQVQNYMQKNIDAETLRNAAMGVLPPAPEGYEAPPQVSRLLAGARREREKRENESAAASAAATSSLLSMHSLGTAGTGQSSHSFGPHGPAPVGDIGAALGGLAGLARAEEGPSHSPAAHPGSRPGLSHHSHSGAASAAAANAHELDEDSVWTTTLTSGLAPKRGENKDWTSLIRLGLGHGANGGGGYVDNRSGSTSASSASSASSSHNSPRPPATEPPAPVATSRPMPVFGGDMTLSLALPNDQPPGGLFSFPFFSLALGYSTLLPAPGAPTSGNGSSNCTTNTNTPRVTAISDVGGLVRLPPLHLWAHKGGAGEAGCSQVAAAESFAEARPVLAAAMRPLSETAQWLRQTEGPAKKAKKAPGEGRKRKAGAKSAAKAASDDDSVEIVVETGGGLQRVTAGPDAGAGSAPAKAKGKPGRKKKGAGERAAGAASFTVAAPAPAPAPAAGAGGAGPKQAKPRSPRGKRKAPPPASPAAAPFVHADEDQDAAQGDFDERSSGPLEDNPLMRYGLMSPTKGGGFTNPGFNEGSIEFAGSNFGFSHMLNAHAFAVRGGGQAAYQGQEPGGDGDGGGQGEWAGASAGRGGHKKPRAEGPSHSAADPEDSVMLLPGMGAMGGMGEWSFMPH